MANIKGNFVNEAIENRLNFVKENYNWSFPTEYIEEYFLELISEFGVDENSSPSEIVDNAVINGEFSIYSDFYETEQKALKAVENGDVLIADRDEIGNLYVVIHF